VGLFFRTGSCFFGLVVKLGFFYFIVFAGSYKQRIHERSLTGMIIGDAGDSAHSCTNPADKVP
jgi:hypothetical protein